MNPLTRNILFVMTGIYLVTFIVSAFKLMKLNIIASGGVSSLDDLDKLKKNGVEGVIVGKAIYENKINLI